MTRRGNCYVASEALFHILGGKAAGWTPMVIPKGTGADTHWFLKHSTGMILDPSRRQFGNSVPCYGLARGCGFLTKRPSKKARELMRRMTWQEVPRA